MHMALGCQHAVMVVGPCAVRRPRGRVVHQHVAGAGIEGEFALTPPAPLSRPAGQARGEVRRVATGGEVGDVGDAANVLQGAGQGGVAEEQAVDVGYQRRTLAAGRDIARPEVADHGDAGELSDDRGRAQLQRRGVGPRRDVPERLTVAADQVGLTRRQPGRGHDLLCGGRERTAQRKVERAQPVDRARFGPEARKNGIAQRGWMRHVAMRQQLPSEIGRRAFDANCGSGCAVGGGAGHKTDDDHGV